MFRLTYRSFNSLILVVASFLTGASLYFEWIQGLLPCPLCVMQRLSVMLIMALSLSALLVRSVSIKKLMSYLQLFFSVVGSGFASRQLYLQSLPPESTPSCGPGLNVLLEYFPWQDVVHALFWGTGECGEVNWTFLNQSMAFWSLLSFLLLLILILGSIKFLDKV